MRPLFAELSQAAFEAARAVGEAFADAIAAKVPALHQSPPRHRLTLAIPGDEILAELATSLGFVGASVVLSNRRVR